MKYVFIKHTMQISKHGQQNIDKVSWICKKVMHSSADQCIEYADYPTVSFQNCNNLDLSISKKKWKITHLILLVKYLKVWLNNYH